ncbi:MAG: U32 family peptidase [Clostridia bacterium]|nr:U32 family peptidase [Clostridia bacterium]
MSIELLSPAGTSEALVAAVQNGADAVYLGAQMLNARAGAGNFDRDALRWAADYAHERGARIHVTVNTMVKESESALLEEVAEQMAFAGVDAAIVQDLGVAKALRAMLPSLPLHASTQMAVHNRQGVRFAKEAGFSRVVLARELTFQEIAACAAEGLEIEAFAHGALCVSCSGQCLFSSLVGGRSGNRGQCAQPCRLPYRLEGAVKAEGFLLSPKDLWTLDCLSDLAEAGVRSLKIEGRLKRPEYVAVVTRAYREALDLLETYGEYEPEEETREALRQIFNRGGFTRGYGPGLIDQELMSHQKPNHAGSPVGRLVAPGKIALTRDVAAADALAFRGGNGAEYPMRLEGAAGETVRARTPAGARPGTTLWRLTSDEQMKEARASMNGENRREPVCGRFCARVGERAALDVTDGVRTARAEGDLVARATGKPADPARVRAQLTKTGAVPYELIDLALNVDADAFLPASMLNDLPRRAFEALGEKRVADARVCDAEAKPLPPPGDPDPDKPAAPRLRVQAPDMASLRLALRCGADEAVFAPEDLTRAALDEAAAQADFPFALALPDTLDGASLEALNAWAWENEGKITAVLRSNAAHLAMKWPGEAHLDAGLNLASRRALEAAGLGRDAALYAPSIELNTSEIRRMGAGGRRELIVYGRMRLMSLRHCPIRAQLGGRHDACARCDAAPEEKKLNAHRLVDRTDAAFPLRRQKSPGGCIVKVMNSVPLMLLRHAGRLPAAAAWRVILTDEDEARTADIVRLHAMALRGEDYKNTDAWRRLENEPSTTGHFFRGVE